MSPIRSSSPGHTLDATSTSRSNPDTPSPVSPSSLSLLPSSAPLQRTPIDPSRVVYLGPLPEDIELPQHETLPRHVGADGQSIPAINFIPDGYGNSDSLGSNYTEYEQRLVEEMTRQTEPGHQGQTPSQHRQTQGLSEQPDQPHTPSGSTGPQSEERLDPGIELIHVPQMAHKRYSWEEGS